MHIWNYIVLNDNWSWYQKRIEKLTFYFTFCLGTLCPMLTNSGTLCPGTLCPGTFWPDTGFPKTDTCTKFGFTNFKPPVIFIDKLQISHDFKYQTLKYHRLTDFSNHFIYAPPLSILKLTIALAPNTFENATSFTNCRMIFEEYKTPIKIYTCIIIVYFMYAFVKGSPQSQFAPDMLRKTQHMNMYIKHFKHINLHWKFYINIFVNLRGSKKIRFFLEIDSNVNVWT